MIKNQKEKWIEAVNEKMKSLEENKTWESTKLPEEKRAIRNKWVFKIKYNSEEKPERYEARLVAKGYSQKYGEDYDAIFAPVVKQSSVRILLSVAAVRKMTLRHFDVKTAFLNGDMTEELYMELPEGHEKYGSDLVCKLNKSLYGLKQSARAWNLKFNQVITEIGFNRSQADPCFYYKNENNKNIYILCYVDDLLVCYEDEKEVERIKNKLNNYFELKDLGEARNYLGIKIERNEKGDYLICQDNKINKILETFGISNAKGASTPMDTQYHKLKGEEDVLPNNEQYRKAVGALLYVATNSRPDISASLGILCRQVSQPRSRDWVALKRIMRYLKQTKNMKLLFSAEGNLELTGYDDSDWAGDIKDRKSTSGYIFKLGQSTVSWSSKKQSAVSLSSTEAEYVAAASASQELLWLRQILEDFGLKQDHPVIIYEDNQGCIKLAESEGINSRTKHIDVRCHHLRDLTDRGIMIFHYLETNKMLADALTKALPKSKFVSLRTQMGLIE